MERIDLPVHHPDFINKEIDGVYLMTFIKDWGRPNTKVIDLPFLADNKQIWYPIVKKVTNKGVKLKYKCIARYRTYIREYPVGTYQEPKPPFLLIGEPYEFGGSRYPYRKYCKVSDDWEEIVKPLHHVYDSPFYVAIGHGGYVKANSIISNSLEYSLKEMKRMFGLDILVPRLKDDKDDI